ncbi:MAG: hypothetical protein IJK49_09795 [Prevotella sp.]|nr:hypothetical protein [Prevotella sp.]
MDCQRQAIGYLIRQEAQGFIIYGSASLLADDKTIKAHDENIVVRVFICIELK